MKKKYSDLLKAAVLLSAIVIAESELAQRFGGALIEFLSSSLSQTVWRSPANPQMAQPVVVMIEDRPGMPVSSKWPLPYSTYNTFLTRVWCLGARSVFLDISFAGARNSASQADPHLAQLASTIKTFTAEHQDSDQLKALWQKNCRLPGLPLDPSRLAAARMPIFLATPLNTDDASPEWQLLHSYSVSASVGNNNTYQPHGPDSEDGRTTAAFALFNEECHRNIEHANCDKDYTDTKTILISDTAYTPLIERDFVLPSSDDADCIYSGPGVPARLPLQSIGSYVFGAQDYRLACAPVITLSWQRVLGAHNLAGLAHAIKGNALFVGASLPGATDYFQTPLHLKLPGVYLHALTFQQLQASTHLPHPASAWERLLALVGPMALTLWLMLIIKSNEQSGVGIAARRPRLCQTAALGLGVVAMALAYRWLGWSNSLTIRDAVFFAWCCNFDFEVLDPLRWISDQLTRVRTRLLRDFGVS